MQTVTARGRSLPHVGQLFELDTMAGQTLTVVVHNSGRRDIELQNNDSAATVTLTDSEALALAGLLTGVIVEVETLGGD